MDDCQEGLNINRGGVDVNSAWNHMIIEGIVKPLPSKYESCELVDLCIGRYNDQISHTKAEL